jgi:hypothetical protein
MLVDIGESTDVRQEVDNHERKSCWEKLSRITLAHGALYLPESDEAERK